jgi:NAD(P)-dependent dehydrogenase (short-subunit alcohol dehydrogenase family)
VSSGQGSLTLANDTSSPYYNFKGAVYQSSKAALNMYSIILAYELRETEIKVNRVYDKIPFLKRKVILL